MTVRRSGGRLLYRPCSLHTLRERNNPRGGLKAPAHRAATDSPLPDFSTVLNRDRPQGHFEIRDSQPHTASPAGHAASRSPTEAWLYRLAIRENSEASVTHGFGTHDHMSCDGRGAQRPGLRCRQHQPASRATVPGALGLRPARQSAPFTWSFGNSCEDADTRRARCPMKPWLNVSEAAEYASLSRDTIYTACERGELRSARVSGRRAIRIRPAWIDAWLERQAPDVQDRRRIGDAQNGAAS